MSKLVYIVCGLDRLGKSTLIQGIMDRLGYFQVIHFSKPPLLNVYSNTESVEGVPDKSLQAYHAQSESFRNAMILANSGGRIIFDRAWLGEQVYANMYRGYDGGYVFDLEKRFHLDQNYHIRLILLTEDFSVSKHFLDDGQSLGPIEKREEEQTRFLEAFKLSCIPDKRIISVTDKALGGFRSKEDILAEALG